MKYDNIGPWSEIKLDIIKKYASAYSTILSKKGLDHIYIDAFAGAGKHISKKSREFVNGSPLNALNVVPAFKEYHFIDLESIKVKALEEMAEQRNDVFIYQGDCNVKLLDDIFPRARYKDYRRALCILDPYGLHLDWNVTKTAGDMKSVELFINFPIMDINRNVLRKDRKKVDSEQKSRLTFYWGDDSWEEIAYEKVPNLFVSDDEKISNEKFADAFRKRLKKVAGFEYVPEPMPMRNSTNVVIYYLYFASYKKVGEKIVKEIFDKYRRVGFR